MDYIIQDKQQYWQYQEAFRTRARNKQTTAQDHILYNFIRGKDLKRGFTPITNANKLSANYANNQWHAFSQALQDLTWALKSKHATFKSRYENITEEQWTQILEVLGGAR
jgi:hypothetical protein